MPPRRKDPFQDFTSRVDVNDIINAEGIDGLRRFMKGPAMDPAAFNNPHDPPPNANKYGDLRTLNGTLVSGRRPGGNAEFARFRLPYPMPCLITWQATDSAGADQTPSLAVIVRSSVVAAQVATDVIGGVILTPPQVIVAQSQIISVIYTRVGDAKIFVVVTPLTGI